MTVLYRKYRPQTFDDIRGQDHVTTTLKNALINDNVTHAYLFSGPRGTGKTSVARILAKELKITDVDLIEIDAASYRGIDKIREVRESVHFQPTQSPRKMYILDEAHMLTNEAFNALLKTLEEPPSYVHFVLCTTEPHKIPLTISSRCQRFDFSLAEETILQDFVTDVAKKEGFEIEKEAVSIIAKLAKGSFRDAIVLVEQAIHHSDDETISAIVLTEKMLSTKEEDIAHLYNTIIQKDLQGMQSGLKDTRLSGVQNTLLLDKLIEYAQVRLLEDESEQEMAIGHVVALGILIEAKRLLQYTDSLVSALLVAVQRSNNSKLPGDSMLQVGSGSGNNTNNHSHVTEDEDSKQSKLEDEKSSKGNDASLQSFETGDSVDWSQLLSIIKSKSSLVEALLKGGSPGEIKDDLFTIKFAYTFHKEKMEETANKQVVEDALSELLGGKIRLRCILDENGNGYRTNGVSEVREDTKMPENISIEIGQEKNGESGTQSSVAGNKSTKSSGTSSSSNVDLLELAQDVFGGEIIE